MRWVNGQVDCILVGDFKFAHRFSGLSDDLLSQAIQIVNAQFSGVYSLWSILPPSEARAKRELCINYLVAWWITNSYPQNAVNVSSSGAVPITTKKVGQVSIKYRDSVIQEGSVLDALTSNEFGIQAMLMIQTAPENYMVVR